MYPLHVHMFSKSQVMFSSCLSFKGLRRQVVTLQDQVKARSEVVVKNLVRSQLTEHTLVATTLQQPQEQLMDSLTKLLVDCPEIRGMAKVNE